MHLAPLSGYGLRGERHRHPIGANPKEAGTSLTRKLLAAVGILIALLVVVGIVGEFAGPRLVESRVEERVRANTEGEVTVEADVQSSPFLPVLLTQGRINRMTVTLDELTGQRIPLAMRYILDRVALNRQALLTGKTELRDIEGGGVTVELTERAISPAMNMTTDISPDGITLGPASVVLEADLTTEGRTVVISNESFENLEVTLPESLLPCEEPETELDDEAVRLFCDLEALPPVLGSVSP